MGGGVGGGSVTHLLGDLVGVEDAGHRQLDLVLLLLGLAQRRLPLLQEQVRGVLARKLLGNETRERVGYPSRGSDPADMVRTTRYGGRAPPPPPFAACPVGL